MPYPYYTYNDNDFNIYYDDNEEYIYKETYDNTGYNYSANKTHIPNNTTYNPWHTNTTTIPNTITYPVSIPIIPNWQDQYTKQPFGLNNFWWDYYTEETGREFIEKCLSISPEDKKQILTHKFIGGMKTSNQLNPNEYLFTAVCKDCKCSFQISNNIYVQISNYTQTSLPYKIYGIYYVGNPEASQIMINKQIDFLTLSCNEYEKIVKKHENLLVLK